jgi:phenylacetate-CoA ligase
MVSTDYSKANLELFTTSGTSATPLRFYRSIMELSWARGAEFRAYGWAGYRLGDKLALIWGFEPEQTRSFTFRFYHLFTRQRILNVNIMSDKSMSSFAGSLVRLKPDFVKGYSAASNVFANYLLKNQQFKIQPRAVFTSAATLLPHHRKAIEKAFNCKVYDFYGSREISGIAAQCGQHEGLHVSDENVVLETVKDGEAASVGEDGQIYLTNLHSHAMPFIRYDIGDTGRSLPDECPCGRKLSLMKPFGRTYEYLANSDGTFTTLRDIQQVFEDLPIVDFQIAQEDYDEIVVRIVARSGYNQTHTNFIAEHLKLRGKAKIRVELVNTILKEKSGKTRHIITKLPSHRTG